MEDTKVYSFHGSLTDHSEGPAEFSATISFPSWDPTGLSVDILWLGNEDQRRRGAFALRHPASNHVWLDSLDPFQGPAELRGINQVRTKSAGSFAHSSSVGVAAVQIGITKDKCQERRTYDAVVQLQPSGILCLPSIHNLHFTGEIRIERITSGEVKLKFKNSSFEAREAYEYYKTIEDGNNVAHQVQRASLIGKVVVGPGDSLFEQMKA